MNRRKFLSLALCLVLLLAGCADKGDSRAGTYTGTGNGHKGPVVLSVELDDQGAMTAISVTEQAEDAQYAAPALDTLPDRIVAEQSLGVDVVSGATITSRAILEAVADALTQAGLDPAALGYVSVEQLSNEEVVVLYGLASGVELQLTGELLKRDFEPVTLTAVSISSSGEEKEVVATGVTLGAILEEYGASPADFAAVLTVASDGYSIEIPGEILHSRDILIAYEVNGEPQSLRTVIPDERAMYWSKFLSRIELLGAEQVAAQPITQLLLLESAISLLADRCEPYQYYDKTGSALPIAALLEQCIEQQLQTPVGFVQIRSTDQLEKSERYDVFRQQYILYEGVEEDVPLFIGPDLPVGMRVKQLLTVQVGPVCVASLDMAQQVEQPPLALADFMELAGLPLEDWAEYRLRNLEGELLNLNGTALQEAVLSHDEGGLPLLRFPSGQFNGQFAGLLSIEQLAGEGS